MIKRWYLLENHNNKKAKKEYGRTSAKYLLGIEDSLVAASNRRRKKRGN
jgi:hypothetical protein